MKLSELKAKLNDPSLDLDTIVDDSSGKTLGDLRKELGVNRDGFTKATQKAADLERGIQERDTKVQQLTGQLQQYEQHLQQLQQGQRDAKATAEAAGVDWKTDPLYAPIAKYYDEQLNGAKQVIGQLVNAVKAVTTTYATDRQAFIERENQREVERMKSLYPDFDKDKVVEAAKRYQINDWAGAYHAWKGEQTDTLIAEREKAAREEGIKLGAEKSGTAPVTETGGGAPAARPVGEERPKNWSDAWGSLVGDLKELGVGG